MGHLLFGMRMDKKVMRKTTKMVLKLGNGLVGMQMGREVLKNIIKIINEMD